MELASSRVNKKSVFLPVCQGERTSFCFLRSVLLRAVVFDLCAMGGRCGTSVRRPCSAIKVAKATFLFLLLPPPPPLSSSSPLLLLKGNALRRRRTPAPLPHLPISAKAPANDHAYLFEPPARDTRRAVPLAGSRARSLFQFPRRRKRPTSAGRKTSACLRRRRRRGEAMSVERVRDARGGRGGAGRAGAPRRRGRAPRERRGRRGRAAAQRRRTRARAGAGGEARRPYAGADAAAAPAAGAAAAAAASRAFFMTGHM